MSEEAPIRILIVDDHVMVREGLEALLKTVPGFQVVGGASTGAQAVELCERIAPDVVLMDLIMPDMDGIEATKRVRTQWSEIQVLALTSYDDQTLVQGVLGAGALGYILKYATGQELVKAIRAAKMGNPTLAPEAVRALVSISRNPPRGHDLTEREREILNLLVEGLNNQEIGERLHISPLTVRNHVSNILEKLNVSTRTEAAIIAIREKLVGSNGRY